ncbi:flagellar biosynthetic protein FliR [Paenibacillus ginsengihumi]|jgi:flagellar biosynthetic protein FliR|uniref:flagellar biosynthetic protein FliR n=1 Tax=Paenibacillus ginsengihumi TaxID=431596 RepID=UPI0003A48975|nr:flagellar biosynthetic protein FliR [Paenibacillus ginsengihumi]
MEWLTQHLPGLMLYFCRITSFLVVSPVFSAHNVPAPFKIGLACFTAFIAYFAYGAATPVTIDEQYFPYVIREVLVGIALGFVAYLFFTVVQIAGAFIDIQLGFGIANVIDPLTGAQSPVLGNFKYVIALLLFFAFNGHHMLLRGIIDSYEWIPLTNELFALMYGGQLSEFFIKSFGEVFALAFQMAAPIVISLFLTDLGLGLLARVAPQFNIFVIGLPLKILLGFAVLLFIFPGFESLFRNLFNEMFETMEQFFGLFAN